MIDSVDAEAELSGSVSLQPELFCVANDRREQMGLQAHPYQPPDNGNSLGSMRQFVIEQSPSRL